MDMLRFGYRAKMRTTTEAEPVPVVWYRLPDDAPGYSGPTVFRSRNWSADPFNDGMGEQSEGRVCCGRRDIEWYNGKKPAALVPSGDPCGTDEVARVGGGPGDPLYLTRADGSAPCCQGGGPAYPAVLRTGMRMRVGGLAPLTYPAELRVGMRMGVNTIRPALPATLEIGMRLENEVVPPKLPATLEIGMRLEAEQPYRPLTCSELTTEDVLVARICNRTGTCLCLKTCVELAWSADNGFWWAIPGDEFDCLLMECEENWRAIIRCESVVLKWGDQPLIPYPDRPWVVYADKAIMGGTYRVEVRLKGQAGESGCGGEDPPDLCDPGECCPPTLAPEFAHYAFENFTTCGPITPGWQCLRSDDGCVWVGNTLANPVTWILDLTQPLPQLTAWNPTSGVVLGVFIAESFDCEDGDVFNLELDPFGCGWPLSITLIRAVASPEGPCIVIE